MFQVQREALFHKSERQAAESQVITVQKQLSELQAQSRHIQELHKDIQESQGLVKEKDRKVRAYRSSFTNNNHYWGGEVSNFLRNLFCFLVG